VKEFLKAVNIWWRYKQKFGGMFFDSRCTVLRTVWMLLLLAYYPGRESRPSEWWMRDEALLSLTGFLINFMMYPNLLGSVQLVVGVWRRFGRSICITDASTSSVTGRYGSNSIDAMLLLDPSRSEHPYSSSLLYRLASDNQLSSRWTRHCQRPNIAVLTMSIDIGGSST